MPTLVTVDGDAVEQAAETLVDAPGLTALLLVPSTDAAEHAERVAQARMAMDGLAKGERVGLWLGRETLSLLADITDDHAHVRARLDAAGAQAPGARTDDVQQLRGVLRGIGGGWEPARLTVRVFDSAPPETAAAELVRVGACPKSGDELVLELGSKSCSIATVAPIEHLTEHPCVAGQAAADAYPWAHEIAFQLTADELATFTAFTAQGIKEDFPTHVILGDAKPIKATAHLRGSTSIDRCDRHSLTVDLGGPSARRLVPGAADDRFHLLSMCQDDRYYHQAVGFDLMRQLGGFPLDTRFVKVRIGGENRGVYLFVEHVRDTLVADRAAVTAVIRRRFDPGGAPEDVKYPKNDPAGAADALDRYHGLVTLAQQGSVAQSLALDRYLDWLALNTLLRNGDYIDEAYFFASAEADGQWYWRAAGWDPDDLAQDCHHEGKHAVKAPHDLLYCAEGALDHALMASDAVFQRYTERLEWMLTDGVSSERLAKTVDSAVASLLAALDDDETAAAMVELVESNPAAITAKAAHADISAHAHAFVEATEVRRQALLKQLQAFRSETR